jgi:hypothetical protein
LPFLTVFDIIRETSSRCLNNDHPK